MKTNIEFYTSPDGEILIKENGMPLREMTEHDTVIVEELFERIRRDYPGAAKALHEAYGKSEKNILYYRFLCVSRFIRCNFSNYDTLTIDIDNEGAFNFEQVPCPMRGECKGYKRICCPKYNTTLSVREMQILEMYVKPMDMDDIADEIHLSPFTIDMHIRNIRKKTGAKNKATLVKLWHSQLKK